MHRVVHPIFKIPHQDAYSPMSLQVFQQLVIFPYMAMRLIAQDQGISDTDAWTVLKASTLYGLVQFPHDDDVLMTVEKALQPKLKKMRVS